MKLRFHSIKMYSCEYCKKPFIRNDAMLRHKREVHEWELRFECEKCEKNLKENITSTDINRLAVAARGVTFNLNLPGEKKSRM